MLITGFDRIVVRIPQPQAGRDAFERFLGTAAVGGRIATGNCALEVIEGAGDAIIAFATDDVEETTHRLQRRGITSADGVLSRDGFQFLLASAATPPTHTSDIYALDHVVVHTPNPDRAVALYGGRLGLDLRLEREREAWSSRMHFFRCGDAVLEVVYRLGRTDDPASPDVVWGQAWRSVDVAATRDRLAAEGFSVSELRAGRKPGTAVMTVKDPLPTPTLVIGPAVVA